MPWTEITLTVPNFLKDAVTGELSELGASGIWEIEETGPEHTRLVAYFEESANIQSVRDALQLLFQREELSLPAFAISSVADQDWGEKWKKSWRSFPIGRRFYVIPSWSDAECPLDRLPLYIDPGQAFGTGTHETTQLTLEAMEVWMEPRRIVLDVGAGSAILAIAAKLLGARLVCACDSDPVAVEVARENLERNSVSSAVLYCGSVDAVANGAVGFVVCNLTADVIGEILPEIHRAMRPQGIAVFSGILNSQTHNIRQVAKPLGFAVLQEKARGEWCALVMRKNGP
jgi:ribosomal protein L11 methyltransferase